MPEPADPSASPGIPLSPAPPDAAPARPDRAIFWSVWLSLLVLLALAFVLLITHQVRLAEARRQAAQVQLAAFEDCLQYVRGSTIASCTRRLGRHGGNAAGESTSAAVPELTLGPASR